MARRGATGTGAAPAQAAGASSVSPIEADARTWCGRSTLSSTPAPIARRQDRVDTRRAHLLVAAEHCRALDHRRTTLGRTGGRVRGVGRPAEGAADGQPPLLNRMDSLTGTRQRYSRARVGWGSVVASQRLRFNALFLTGTKTSAGVVSVNSDLGPGASRKCCAPHRIDQATINGKLSKPRVPFGHGGIGCAPSASPYSGIRLCHSSSTIRNSTRAR